MPSRAVDLAERLVRAVPEQIEQIGEIAPFDQCQLEMQQGVLARVDVDRVNFRRGIEQVIQRVAPGAGEHHDPTVVVQIENLPVDAWIFPADVVDQAALVNCLEHQIVRAVDQFRADFLDHAINRRGKSERVVSERVMMGEQGDKRMADSLIFGEKTGPGGFRQALVRRVVSWREDHGRTRFRRGALTSPISNRSSSWPPHGR